MSRTLHGLLRARALERPEQPFLYFHDQIWTYADLDWCSEAAAARFQNLGIRERERVALLLPNGPEFVLSFFGALKAGAAAVPINGQLKVPELLFILNNCRAAGLVLGPEQAGRAAELRAQCPHLRWIEVLPQAGLKAELLQHFQGAGELSPVAEREGGGAAVIYTSGTTGFPKGVVLTHSNYLWNASAAARAVGLTEADRFLGFLPLYHVNAQVAGLLAPLAVGASTTLMERFQAHEFFELLARRKISAFSAVPSLYSILLSLPEAVDLSGVRLCLSGAAPLPVEILERFEAKFKAHILEGYGLSEATCVSSVNPPGRRKPGSIGLPLPGQGMAVFDDEHVRLPPGQVGEIRVQGPNVMKGYFDDPRGTAGVMHDGWLRTGDLGCHDRDGYFYIVGRKKEMIIRGGENIYPKEIEDALYRHPKVAEAAVVGLPDRRWGEEVAAFVVLKEGLDSGAQELADYLKDLLADFKIPRKFLIVPSLPRTPTGKVQKHKLKEEYGRQS